MDFGTWQGYNFYAIAGSLDDWYSMHSVEILAINEKALFRSRAIAANQVFTLVSMMAHNLSSCAGR